MQAQPQMQYKDFYDIKDVLKSTTDLFKSIKDSDPKELQNAYQFLAQSHELLSSRFPMVLRMMVFEKEYNEKAFEKYIMWMSSKNYEFKTQEDQVESKVKYFELLYKETHKHYDNRKLGLMKQQMKDAILKEDAIYENIKKELPGEMKRSEERTLEYQKKKLYELLMKKKQEQQ